MQADANQLAHLKVILDDFATSTGLKVNFSKSSMYSINVPEAIMVSLAAVLSCQIGTMPFTYLGLPMGTTKPRMLDLTPLMDKIQKEVVSLFLPTVLYWKVANDQLGYHPCYYIYDVYNKATSWGH